MFMRDRHRPSGCQRSHSAYACIKRVQSNWCGLRADANMGLCGQKDGRAFDLFRSQVYLALVVKQASALIYILSGTLPF